MEKHHEGPNPRRLSQANVRRAHSEAGTLGDSEGEDAGSGSRLAQTGFLFEEGFNGCGPLGSRPLNIRFLSQD